MYPVQKLKLLVSLFIILLIVSSPITALAASFDFTITAKTAFDKMTAAANKTTADKLTQQYAELKNLQKQDINWDTTINELHYQNEEAVLLARKKIKEIDAPKLLKLAAEVEQAKKKYDPLFNTYDTLNQQLKVARSIKNKTLISLLAPQVETVKVAVQVAKLDIRNKEAIYRTAKEETANAMKKTKDILAGIDPLKVKIKAEKGSVSSTKKHFSTEVNVINQVARKGDSTATLSSFIRLISLQRQIIAQKQKMYAYEQQIATVIVKTNAQIAGK